MSDSFVSAGKPQTMAVFSSGPPVNASFSCLPAWNFGCETAASRTSKEGNLRNAFLYEGEENVRPIVIDAK